MLSFIILLFVFGALSALIPGTEIVKVVVMLFTIPIILFFSTKISKNTSVWTVRENNLEISFKNGKHIYYDFTEIDHLRSLTRSGGNLYVFYLIKKSPQRYWRNQLFQKDDDHLLLHQALVNSSLEYYKI